MRKLHEVTAALERMRDATLDGMFAEAIAKVPALKRGKVWCRTCRREQDVNSGEALRHGWPKCHGHTMTIDHPDTW